MKTVGEIISLSTKYLEERKIAKPRLQAEELLADLLGCKRIDLYMQFERPLDENELAAFREKLKRRGKGEPLGYLLSGIEFFHSHFEISPAVLIPRPETEILVAKIADQLKTLDLNQKVAWDLCAGSGVLGISLKKQFPDLAVTLSDLSESALKVAEKNAEKNQAEVQFLQGDLLKPFFGKKADFIFCNPPYIGEEEYRTLDPEVAGFEPKQALLAGNTGLEFYARLAQELPAHLNPGAKVFFEIGTGQGSAVQKLFSAPCWTKRQVEKDWAGHDRFFFLEFQ